MAWSSQERTLVTEFLREFDGPTSNIGTLESNPFVRRVMLRRPLRGLGANQVLIGKGEGLDRVQLEKAVRTAAATKTLLIVLAMDELSYSSTLAFQESGTNKLIVLGCSELLHITENVSPQDAFLEILRNQISFLALVPFETSSPASGPFFTGRAAELRKLQSIQDYAIAGPGGMGKTSLLRHWIWLRRVQDFELYERTFEIDLMGVAEPDDAARKIYAAIERKVLARSSQSDWLTVRTFPESAEALHREYARRCNSSEPFHLVLDEVGSLLEVDRRRTLADYFQNATASGRDSTPYPFLHVLRNLVNERVFRITLCSRRETRELLSDSNNPFSVDGEHSRLKLLEMEPLDEREAARMLKLPLQDLGLDITALGHRIDEALENAKGIPFRIADYGLDIALEADVRSSSRSVSGF